ncbi:MAG: sigma 54-interacting transcriptional regulator [Pseudomonadales bacterium]
MTSTLESESERARLIATGISSVIGCPFAGIGLRRSDGGWAGFFDLPAGSAPVADAELEQIHVALGGRRSRRLDAAVDPAPALLERYGLGALVGYPLATRRDSHGLLLIGLDQDIPLSPEQGHACHLLASALALGIENLRLRANLEDLVAERTQALELAASRQQGLLRLTNDLVRNLDRESLLQAICDSLEDLLPFDRASLDLLDETRQQVVLHAVTGALKHPLVLAVGHRVALDSSVLSEVIQKNQPRTRNDLDTADLTAEEVELYQIGVRSYVLYPLYFNGEVIGSLNLSSTRCNAYKPADVDLIGQVAAQVALAVANMLTFEEVQSLRSRAEQENVYLKEELRTEHGFNGIAGQSAALATVLSQVEQVAPTRATVLICGETGTGKELIARAIHAASDRRDHNLVKINCAAISAGLVESELFGHEKGAFTGAAGTRVGRFEFADGGTLFLDEVGELTLDTQAKLLRVLQEGEFERVGSNRPIKTDVRLIAATNRDLQQAVAAGDFRSDLYYRLSVFPISLPALRDRPDDIPLICEHLLVRLSRRLGRTFSGIEPESLASLTRYPWPGNIRELQNVLERAAILSPGPVIRIDDLVADEAQAPEGETAPASLPTLEDAERAHIVAALRQTNWVIAGPEGAAELLDINPNTLRSRMKKMGISRAASAVPGMP